MKAGIIAAGTGSRFLQAGWKQPKPLIKVNGKPLIDHVLANFFDAGIESVDILLNGEPRFDRVETHLRELPEAPRIRIHRKSPPTSYDSFCFVMKRLGNAPFLISTVDAICPGQDLQDFLRIESYPQDCPLVLAVTDFVHDEKPLWVDLADGGRIEGMGDSATSKQHVTAGLYLVLRDLNELTSDESFPALRYFLQRALRDLGSVWSRKFHTVLDIDNPEDIDVAEAILQDRSRMLS